MPAGKFKVNDGLSFTSPILPQDGGNLVRICQLDIDKVSIS
jgi:hypothetical protein